MTRSQFAKSLQEGLNTHFGLAYTDWQTQYTAIFTSENSKKAFEEDQLLAAFGQAPVKTEGSGVEYDEGREVWTARYVHETIALAFSITEEAEEDNLYLSLGQKYAKALARSLRHTKETKGANVLNNGFDSAYAGGDGKELFATDHPLSGGGTLANELTTAADLSETSLEQACIDISNFVDERGLNIMVKAKKLIIPTNLQFVAQRLLHSDLRVETANNDVNAIKSMGSIPGGYAINNYLTNADDWFIITDAGDGLKHMRRTGVKRGVEGDFETGNMRYKARERYVFGWTDPRGAFGSPGV